MKCLLVGLGLESISCLGKMCKRAALEVLPPQLVNATSAFGFIVLFLSEKTSKIIKAECLPGDFKQDPKAFVPEFSLLLRYIRG